MALYEILDECFNTFTCFKIYSVEEISELIDYEIDEATLKKILFEESNFIPIENESTENDLFILDLVLFRWYCRLNLRLAKARQFALSSKQVISLLNQLCYNKRSSILPLSAIKWGETFGLILPTISGDRYVFPLSRVLTLMKPLHIDLVGKIFDDFCIERVWDSKLGLNTRSWSCSELGFSNFDDQTCHIVKNRESLLDSRKKTLQEIGAYYHLSRERIRQLEINFWSSLEFGYRLKPLFIKAFILDYFSEGGRMIVDNNSQEINYRRFLAKCIGLHHVSLDAIGLTFLGLRTIPKPILDLRKWFPDKMDISTIADQVNHMCLDQFSTNDILLFSNKVASYVQSSLNLSQKVYLALRTIGRPAHYLKVTEVYNSLWPESPLSEGRLHNILARQKQSIVWVGIDGAYALREWGYDRPLKDLFQTIVDIVNENYKKTNLPVHFTLIQSELSKYRKLVKATSLSMALHWNPRIKSVGKNLFVPQDPDKEEGEDRSLETLDKIFREFQKDTR